MNTGIIVGQAQREGNPISNVDVYLTRIEGDSSQNAGRGVRGGELGLELFTERGFRVTGIQLRARTNEQGCYAIRFQWNFLGSGGVPNDMNPFFHCHAIRIAGLEGRATRVRKRGYLGSSPRTFADLTGMNIPTDGVGAVGMGTDMASLMRGAGVTTMPSPLVGHSIISNYMFLGIWVFNAL